MMSFCVQVCYHIGSEADPDQRDKQTDKSDIEILKHFIAQSLPGLVPEPAVVESCLYTVRTSVSGPPYPSESAVCSFKLHASLLK